MLVYVSLLEGISNFSLGTIFPISSSWCPVVRLQKSRRSNGSENSSSNDVRTQSSESNWEFITPQVMVIETGINWDNGKYIYIYTVI